MPRVQIQFGARSYSLRAKPISAQSCINFTAEWQDGDSKSRLTIHPRPGTPLFGTIGSGPIRGVHEYDGTLYVVSGTSLYSVNASGVGTSLGTIAGTGRVSMKHNLESQLMITNGSQGYVYTIGGSVVQITDADYYAGYTLTFHNQRMIQERAGTSQFIVSLEADASNWPADYIDTSEADSDNVIAVETLMSELWIFNSKTIEIYSDIAASPFPYSASPGGLIEIGCGAKFSVAKKGPAIYWLGNDGRFYRSENGLPMPISTPAIEYMINKTIIDYSDAESMLFSLEGHDYYLTTFRATEKTIVYNIQTNFWSEWSYYDTTQADNRAAFRGRGYAYCYNKHIVGDFENGNLYYLDYDTATDTENGDPIIFEVVSPPIYADGRHQFFSSLFLDLEVGRGRSVSAPTEATARLSWSNDGGYTFGTELTRSIGALGNYKKKVYFDRLGYTRNSRVFKYRSQEPAAIVGAFIDVEVGND